MNDRPLKERVIYIISNPENLTTYERRSYWADELILMVERDVASRAGVALSRNPSDTSRDAAMGVLPRSGSRLARIYSLIQSRSGYGATDSEIESALEMSHQSASAARNTLMNRGLLKDSGQRRKTASGAMAKVWITTSPSSKEPDAQGDRSVPVPPRGPYAPCPHCGRSGVVGHYFRCPYCSGSLR